MICKNSSKEIEDGVKICPECGAKINSALEVSQENSKNQNSSENEESKENSFFKRIMADEKKRKIFIAAVVAIVIVIVVIIFSYAKSDSDNSYYGNSDDNGTGYSDYDEDFGNDEVVTQPQTTQPVTANQNTNIEINYPEGTIYYSSYGSEIGMKITDVKSAVSQDGDVTIQIEVEKVSQKLTDDLERREDGGGLRFYIGLDIYDANGMIIEPANEAYQIYHMMILLELNM